MVSSIVFDNTIEFLICKIAAPLKKYVIFCTWYLYNTFFSVNKFVRLNGRFFIFVVGKRFHWWFVKVLSTEIKQNTQELSETPPDKHFNAHVCLLVHPTTSGFSAHFLPHLACAIDDRSKN